MPRPGAKVDSNIIGIEEEDRLHLDVEDWRALEDELAKPIPDKARAALAECCRQFLIEKKLEVEAASLQEVKALLDVLATTSERSVAGADMLERIHRHLTDVMIEVDLDPDRNVDEIWTTPNRPHAARLTRRVAAGIIVHVRTAVAKAIDEVDAELGQPSRSAFRPGVAFERFLVELHSWAKDHSLPSSVNNRAGETPFSKFAFALHRLFPRHLQDRAASTRALQSRMNELLRKQKKPA